MNCPLCSANETCPYACAFQHLHQCGRCGFIFVNHPVDSSNAELYEEEWSKTEVQPTYVFADGEYRIRNADKMQAILARVEPYRKLNGLLDVGCSAAFFLKLAKERGWQVQGVEVSNFGVKFSREQLGIEVFQGLLQEARFPSESFDVVNSSHVIEHVADPRGLLREMRRLLRPGGVLVTVVPTQFAAPGYRFFGKLTGEGPPRHVSFFTKRIFERLLRAEGFRVVFSRQNVELQKLAAAARRASPPAEGAPAATNDARPSALVRFVKANINFAGTLFGLGDELTTIGVKV